MFVEPSRKVPSNVPNPRPCRRLHNCDPAETPDRLAMVPSHNHPATNWEIAHPRFGRPIECAARDFVRSITFECIGTSRHLRYSYCTCTIYHRTSPAMVRVRGANDQASPCGHHLEKSLRRRFVFFFASRGRADAAVVVASERNEARRPFLPRGPADADADTSST
jgi:hypothetical protein